MDDYKQLVLSVNQDLRGEVVKLYKAWQDNVLPLNLQAKATSFGKLKEKEVWDEVYAQLDSGNRMDES